MSGKTLTTTSTLMCPHGGSVQIITTNSRVTADGGFVALATDSFIISGCPNQIPAAPSPIPSPCIQVQWLVPDTRNTINGTPTLNQSSVGLCLSATGIPQGQVSIVNTQSRARSS